MTVQCNCIVHTGYARKVRSSKLKKCTNRRSTNRPALEESLSESATYYFYLFIYFKSYSSTSTPWPDPVGPRYGTDPQASTVSCSGAVGCETGLSSSTSRSTRAERRDEGRTAPSRSTSTSGWNAFPYKNRNVQQHAAGSTQIHCTLPRRRA